MLPSKLNVLLLITLYCTVCLCVSGIVALTHLKEVEHNSHCDVPHKLICLTHRWCYVAYIAPPIKRHHSFQLGCSAKGLL